MDLLNKILNDVPDTWEHTQPYQYQNSKYHLVELDTFDAEARNVKSQFPQNCRIRYIKRVEDPFQLALFKIMKAKRLSEGRSCTVAIRYHIIWLPDLEKALEHTVDYRRYTYKMGYSQHDFSKHPKFFADVTTALQHFKTYSFAKVVLVCEVLGEYGQDMVNSQGDYTVKYVVCLDIPSNTEELDSSLRLMNSIYY